MAQKKKNPHRGESLDDFIDSLPNDEQIAIRATGLKMVLAEKARKEMEKQRIGVAALQKRMHTSRSQLQRTLDGNYTGVSLKNLVKLYSALGKELHVTVK